VEPGDSVTITFSEPLLASSLCGAWAEDGVAKSLTNGVIVSIANNGSATSTDLLSVTATGCGAGGFHFGQLDLGGKGYVRNGTTATFGATGASSSITWNPATATLRIVFGGSSTNRFGNVNGSTAVYTPDAALTDTHGLPISGTVSRTARHL
jgi:archaellum component FlaF (FlaF/FlaG flagellin family)